VIESRLVMNKSANFVLGNTEFLLDSFQAFVSDILEKLQVTRIKIANTADVLSVADCEHVEVLNYSTVPFHIGNENKAVDGIYVLDYDSLRF
jgi:hypothetical protein